MEDYYRAAFRKLRPNRRSDSHPVVHGHERPRMPSPLRIVYVASCVLSGLGWVVTVAVGHGGPLHDATWLAWPVLALPVAIALALGFSEDQRWTRPLLALLPGATTALLAFAGLPAAAAALGVTTVALVAYLYGSPGCRAYYAFLRETSVVRVSWRELLSAEFVPLYLGGAGAVIGGASTYVLVRGVGRTFADLGANEAMAAVCSGILAGAAAGVLFRWLGDTWLRRRREPPSDGRRTSGVEPRPPGDGRDGARTRT